MTRTQQICSLHLQRALPTTLSTRAAFASLHKALRDTSSSAHAPSTRTADLSERSTKVGPPERHNNSLNRSHPTENPSKTLEGPFLTTSASAMSPQVNDPHIRDKGHNSLRTTTSQAATGSKQYGPESQETEQRRSQHRTVITNCSASFAPPFSTSPPLRHLRS